MTVAQKKKADAAAAKAVEETAADANEPEKKKRQLTDYNIYVAWKIDQITKEDTDKKLSHREKLGIAAKEWGKLGDTKEEEMKKARLFKK